MGERKLTSVDRVAAALSEKIEKLDEDDIRSTIIDGLQALIRQAEDDISDDAESEAAEQSAKRMYVFAEMIASYGETLQMLERLDETN